MFRFLVSFLLTTLLQIAFWAMAAGGLYGLLWGFATYHTVHPISAAVMLGFCFCGTYLALSGATTGMLIPYGHKYDTWYWRGRRLMAGPYAN